MPTRYSSPRSQCASSASRLDCVPLGTNKPGIETELVGQPLLQRVDRGVLAVDIVADFRRQHRRAHRGRGPGHGVAAQINPFHGALSSVGKEDQLGRIVRFGQARDHARAAEIQPRGQRQDQRRQQVGEQRRHAVDRAEIHHGLLQEIPAQRQQDADEHALAQAAGTQRAERERHRAEHQHQHVERIQRTRPRTPPRNCRGSAPLLSQIAHVALQVAHGKVLRLDHRLRQHLRIEAGIPRQRWRPYGYACPARRAWCCARRAGPMRCHRDRRSWPSRNRMSWPSPPKVNTRTSLSCTRVDAVALLQRWCRGH